MKKVITYSICLFLGALILTGCQKSKEKSVEEVDPLPSWNSGHVKSGLISFAKAVSDEQNSVFVPETDRIVVIDHDGTLMSEWPISAEYYFLIDRIRKAADDHPEWSDDPDFKMVLQMNFPKMLVSKDETVFKWQKAAREGLSLSEYNKVVQQWMETANHPIIRRPFVQLVYQPMLEVIKWFQSRGFKTYIFTHTDPSFVRNWSAIYGIPEEQIVGATPEQRTLDKIFARKPLAVIGNSDRDLPLMEWSDTHEKTNFQMFIHHTDSVRESAYDSLSSVGRLKKGFSVQLDNGWVMANMNNDWKKLYFNK